MKGACLFNCLADHTRLKCLLLLLTRKEMCICELTTALDELQPNVARQLTRLIHYKLVDEHQKKNWSYYRLSPSMPGWIRQLLEVTLRANGRLIHKDIKRLTDTLERRQEMGQQHC